LVIILKDSYKGINLKFSVLLSLYDKENPVCLEACLDSIFNEQTLPPSEVVLVEDGPINTTLTGILDNYQKIKKVDFKRIKLEQNMGLGYALKFGLESCSFELVARMDTDDIAEPTRFEKQINFFLENPDIHILGTSALDIDEYGNVLTEQRKLPEKSADIYNSMWACPILHPTVMFKKSFITAVGSYSTSLKRRQDYELWFRCAKAGAVFHNLQEPLLKYRITAQSYRKNSLSVSLLQAKIGLRGALSLNLGFKAYIGVFYPVFKSILPNSARLFVVDKLRRFDPRRP
jgi:glycosyltransferase involved in cell wall biosynthesis